MSCRYIVTGDASRDALGVLVAAHVTGQPSVYAGGKGVTRVFIEQSGAELTAVGALASLAIGSIDASSARSDSELQQLEWISWCLRELSPAVSSNLPSLEAVIRKVHAAIDSGTLTQGSVAEAVVVAAFHSFPGALALELPQSINAFVAKMRQEAAYKAAVASLASAVPETMPSVFSATLEASGKGGKEKRKAPEPGMDANVAAPAAAGKSKGGKAAPSAAAAASVATLSSILTSAPVSTDDSALMTASVLLEVTRIFTAALHTAFPTARAAGFEKADVVLNTVNTMVHHYQCNSALSLYPKLKGPSEKKEKVAKTADGQTAAGAVVAPLVSAPAAGGPLPPASPRAVADALIAAVESSGPHAFIGKLEASGPGYINVYLPANFIAARLTSTLLHGVRAGPADRLRKVIIDYSSPNIAKDMHIGHLRSTIIGDGIARMLEFAGHTVTRVNHVGDWGTQFGMLIAYLKELVASGAVKDEQLDASIGDLTGFYKASKKRFDGDAAFAAVAHKEVVALQAGDETNLALWRRMVAVSSGMFAEVYKRLGIDSRLLLRGESFYNPLLSSVLVELQGKGLLEEEPGPERGIALVQRVPGQEVPLMVRKSDGGFGYDSTDLAALRYRLQEEKGDWLIYVVDAGQSLHFDLVFKGGLQAGWYDPAVTRVEHVGFGVVLGEDGKKFKTRDGSVVRLTDVLDEARTRAKAIIDERIASGNTPLSAAEAEHAASTLGYGGVKYFDLRQNRVSDYAFSYDRMLSPDGDTAVYLEYAHARMSSILRRAKEAAGIDVDELVASLAHMDSASLTAAFLYAHPSEASLAAELIRFQEVITTFQGDLMPHRVCEYIFFLCGKFSEFFRDCPVLADGIPALLRDSRLRLCTATERTVAMGMRLVGIDALDRI